MLSTEGDNNMEMKMNDIMTELGGAFAVTWLIIGITVMGETGAEEVGLGMASFGGMLVLGIAWMVFAGADILPPITWMKAITSEDLTDQDMWTGTIIRLITQVVGAILATIMMVQLEPDFVTYATAYPDGQDAYAFALWSVVGLIAAGAIHAGDGNPDDSPTMAQQGDALIAKGKDTPLWRCIFYPTFGSLVQHVHVPDTVNPLWRSCGKGEISQMRSI